MQEAQVNGGESSVGTCMLHVCNDALMSEEKIFFKTCVNMRLRSALVRLFQNSGFVLPSNNNFNLNLKVNAKVFPCFSMEP